MGELIQVGGAGLLLLYVVQCAIGSWVHRTPAERRTGAQGALLQIMGVAIILLAFIETWLGIASEGHNKRIWSIILFVSRSCSANEGRRADGSGRLSRCCM
jgi:hypothetical protein